MTDPELADSYRNLRRDLHQHPEPAWCEFYTTARIVEALRARPLDAIHVGPDALAAEARRADAALNRVLA